jgi:hypothetical protein
MPFAPRDLIDRDLKEILETSVVNGVAGDPLDDSPDRRPIDPDQPTRSGLIGLHRQPRHQVLEIAGKPSTRTSERDMLDKYPVLRAAQPPQPTTDLQTPNSEI